MNRNLDDFKEGMSCSRIFFAHIMSTKELKTKGCNGKPPHKMKRHAITPFGGNRHYISWGGSYDNLVSSCRDWICWREDFLFGLGI